jgi:hypothetical protein
MNLFSGGDPNATFFVVGVLLALIVWHLNLHFAPSRALHISENSCIWSYAKFNFCEPGCWLKSKQSIAILTDVTLFPPGRWKNTLRLDCGTC